ncbi:MAG: SDR family NAD(P)-dependent oxidoreductase [Okeania sp. SIO3C4]|nr:SDR family NAD(P)-dependent oxidoreductase [Okeania sp. SIO3B3]NER01948.1 SDR family NAD(P)-dependent oxidoreductase [Okeania sp. SIO3C4]
MQFNWLNDKHIFITGASDGIGRSLAIKCAGICKTLTLVARNSSGKLDELKNELNNSSTEVNIYPMDLNDYSQAESLVSSIYESGNQIDVFVNSAGGTHVYKEFEEMSFEDISTIFDTNARSPIFWMRTLLPKMRQNKPVKPHEKLGQIVFLSSRSAERTLPKLSVYTMAKGAIEKVCEALRNEYSRHNIVFTLINPGSINTSFTSQWEQAIAEMHNDESMTVDEVTEFIIFALNAPFATNKISFESVMQWRDELGVLK